MANGAPLSLGPRGLKQEVVASLASMHSGLRLSAMVHCDGSLRRLSH